MKESGFEFFPETKFITQEFCENEYLVPDMISPNCLWKNELSSQQVILISFVQYFREETCFVEFISHQRQYQ
jgi:hypothetical protein